jgi:hypothetical protein
MSKFLKSESICDSLKGVDERSSTSRLFAQAAAQLIKQSAITHCGGLFERGFMSVVSGDEHGHHVHVRRQLMSEPETSVTNPVPSGVHSGRNANQAAE